MRFLPGRHQPSPGQLALATASVSSAAPNSATHPEVHLGDTALTLEDPGALRLGSVRGDVGADQRWTTFSDLGLETLVTYRHAREGESRILWAA
jgi:hypothetical protein